MTKIDHERNNCTIAARRPPRELGRQIETGPIDAGVSLPQTASERSIARTPIPEKTRKRYKRLKGSHHHIMYEIARQIALRKGPIEPPKGLTKALDDQVKSHDSPLGWFFSQEDWRQYYRKAILSRLDRLVKGGLTKKRKKRAQFEVSKRISIQMDELSRQIKFALELGQPLLNDVLRKIVDAELDSQEKELENCATRSPKPSSNPFHGLKAFKE